MSCIDLSLGPIYNLLKQYTMKMLLGAQLGLQHVLLCENGACNMCLHGSFLFSVLVKVFPVRWFCILIPYHINFYH